ncbi:MAG: hypothetical protein V1737_01385 [Chloroflexota bacterium]
MQVLFTEQFEEALAKLTPAEKRSVQKALALLGDNPRYPGLRVKKMEGRAEVWETRPSRRLRMTFEMAGETLTMRNVGEHDRVLRRP